MNSTESFLDIPYKKQLIASKFAISVYEYILFESIRISVMLCDDNNKVIDKRLFILDGEDYTNWCNPPYNGNDEYLINWVKNRLQQEGNDN